jgi:subtilisin family serine protease
LSSDRTKEAQVKLMPIGRSRRPVQVLLAVLLVGAMGWASPSAAVPALQRADTSAARQATGAKAVTLLTGDVVTVMTRQQGKSGLSVRPAARPSGRTPSFRSLKRGGDTYVVPADVAALVPAVLDLELFNVTGLIRQGFGDDRSTSLPLIVRAGSREPSAATLGALATGGARVDRVLDSIGAVAARQQKTRARSLIPALTRAGTASAKASSTRAARSAAAAELGGVTRIQLDRKTIRVAELDRNLTQVGAPQAWAAGFSGQGVKIAVLDTGVDVNHPDLVSQVLASEDFTGEGDPGDRFGHGTHVAAIAAGSGAAAAGARKGVGFGAKILNGKVCDDFGFCEDSWIIDGMEWAAAQGAKVVNLSLGGVHTDGLDPVEESLEQLSGDGTLFVVAAGNDGPAPPDLPEFGTIGSPGEAPSALTVGAVDADDVLADFSSTGPIQGDFALKPDITAPGVDIIAARAEGTQLGEPVGEDYVKLSGTSMATPHVAGAAAALVQRFPSWSPARLKAALMGSTQPRAGVSAYHQGGGRLDVGRVVTQNIAAETAAVDFGYLRFPHQVGRTHTRDATFRNLGTAAVTLDLTAALANQDGTPAPAGTLALSTQRLTIAAGGTGTVRLTLTEPATPGLYSGRLTATAAGGASVGIPVAVYNEPERFDLTIRLLDGTGAPAIGFTDLMRVDGSPFIVFALVDGQATFRVPRGVYSISSVVPIDSADFDRGAAFLIQPQVSVSGTATITLDGRSVVEAAPSIGGRQTTQVTAVAEFQRGSADGTAVFSSALLAFDEFPIFLQPTARVTVGSFTAFTQWRFEAGAPATAHTTAPDVFDLFFLHPDQVPSVLDYDLSADEVARRMARFGVTFAADPPAAMRGREPFEYVEGFWALHPTLLSAWLLGGTVQPPVKRTHFLLADGQTGWVPEVDKIDPATFDFLGMLGPLGRFRGGERIERTFFEQPLRPRPVVAETLFGTIGPVVRSRGELFPFMPLTVDAAGNFEDFSFRDVDVRARLIRDGRLVAEHDDLFTPFPVVPRFANYRLEVDVDNNGLPTSTRTRTKWSFQSRPPASGERPVPLLVIGYDLLADTSNQVRPGAVPHLILSAARQPGANPAAVTGAEAWLSTDDGRTWKKATTLRLAANRFMVLPAAAAAPRTGALVSLRVRATDSDGGSVEETIIRAYAVGPAS